MDMIHRHFYSFTSLPPRFQKKLYSLDPHDLIVRNRAAPAISSTFAYEDLPQDVFSIILSYADISSARNMLPASNVFYFGTRDCLTCCHKRVFEMYRTSFIEHLLPLFTQIKDLKDKKLILQILCEINTKSVDHPLDPLSVFNTIEPERLETHPFVQKFEELIYGLYPFASCISTREYYYLLRLFILPLLPATISDADPLKPFEQTILSNKFSFDHFLGYLDSFLPLMKEVNLTASILEIGESCIHDMLCSLSYWGDMRYTRNKEKRLFNLCLKDMFYVLLLLKDPLTKKQVDTIVQRVLDEK